jgi:molecular chaperone GrpE
MSDETRTPDGAAESAQEAPPPSGMSTIATEELDKLRKLAAERDQYLDVAARMRAEFENYQKRMQRERETERKYGFGPVALDLLPIYDNLERAINAGKQAGEQGPLVQGVAMVMTQFLELLKRHGITRIDAAGKPFDPNLHQAIMQQPTSDAAPNTIVQVIEHGFMNQDRVLRPAMVVVAAPKCYWAAWGVAGVLRRTRRGDVTYADV